MSLAERSSLPRLEKLRAALRKIPNIKDLREGSGVLLAHWAVSVEYFRDAAVIILYGGSYDISYRMEPPENEELISLASWLGVYTGKLVLASSTPTSEVGPHALRYQTFLGQRVSGRLTPEVIISAAEAVNVFATAFTTPALKDACRIMHRELSLLYDHHKRKDDRFLFPSFFDPTSEFSSVHAKRA